MQLQWNSVIFPKLQVLAKADEVVSAANNLPNDVLEIVCNIHTST